jgi:hypothetical protein
VKLPDAFRRGVLAHESPNLAWADPEDCEVYKGEEIVLLYKRSHTTGGRDQAESWRPGHEELMAGAGVLETPMVTVTITALLRTRNGGVRALYRVRDDRAEFMARGLAKDGRTKNPAQAVDPDAEVVERDFQRRLAKEAQAYNSVLRDGKRQQAEVLRAEAKLNRARGGRTRRVREWELRRAA